MPSDNKRFCEIGGGGVTTQTVAGAKTAGDNPDSVRLSPQLRKAAGLLYASGRERGGQRLKTTEMKI